MWKECVLLCFLASSLAYDPNSGEVLNVFVVPHSHCDPGWWKTFEGYYTQWTQSILDAVTTSLEEDQKRTFVWAEVSFFERWWRDQNEQKKNRVKEIAQEGRLEFVTGGWVSTDEATTHYTDIVNEIVEGHEWLQRNLGVKPRIGWSVDPFGYSPVIPHLLSQAGLEGAVITRVHKDVKSKFRKNKQLEFIWRQNWEYESEEPQHDLFVHMFPYPLYDIPNTCGPNWDICATFDFERKEATPITPSNVAQRSKDLITMYRQKAQNFVHNNVLIPLGDDFKYKTLEFTRKMMDQYQMMFDYMNENPSLNINIKFATLSEYFDAVRNSALQKSIAFPIYHGDFFTYNDQNDDYWSGYFSTRPYAKGLTRATSATLRSAELMYSLVKVYNKGPNYNFQSAFDAITKARRNIGLFQHHDGITGTCRKAVIDDYVARLTTSLQDMQKVIVDTTKLILQASSNIPLKVDPKYEETIDRPFSLPTKKVLKITEELVVIQNSLAHEHVGIVELHVNTPNVRVRDRNGQEHDSQVLPFLEPKKNEISDTVFRLVFLATVPELGMNTYIVEYNAFVTKPPLLIYSDEDVVDEHEHFLVETSSQQEFELTNQFVRVHLSKHGEIQSVATYEKKVDVNQQFLIYETSGSGAYLFRPNGEAKPLPLDSTIFVSKGSVVEEAYVVAAGLSQRVRITKHVHSDYVEIKHIVDIFDIGSSMLSDRELITRYDTSIKNDLEFWVDSNGIEMQRRKTDKSKPISANYYPMTASAFLADDSSQLTVISRQALGVGSLKQGSLEIMLDRLLKRDDGRGLGEGVQDSVPTEITFLLTVRDPVLPPDINFQLSDYLNNPLQVMTGEIPTPKSWDTLAESLNIITMLSPLGVRNEIRILGIKPRFENSDEIILQVFNPYPHADIFSAVNLFGAETMILSMEEYSLSLLYTAFEFKERRRVNSFPADDEQQLFGVKSPPLIEPRVSRPAVTAHEALVYGKEIKSFVLQTAPQDSNLAKQKLSEELRKAEEELKRQQEEYEQRRNEALALERKLQDERIQQQIKALQQKEQQQPKQQSPQYQQNPPPIRNSGSINNYNVPETPLVQVHNEEVPNESYFWYYIVGGGVLVFLYCMKGRKSPHRKAVLPKTQ